MRGLLFLDHHDHDTAGIDSNSSSSSVNRIKDEDGSDIFAVIVLFVLICVFFIPLLRLRIDSCTGHHHHPFVNNNNNLIESNFDTISSNVFESLTAVPAESASAACQYVRQRRLSDAKFTLLNNDNDDRIKTEFDKRK
jgi:hypothetical protein